MKRTLLTFGCSLALAVTAGSAWAEATCSNPSPFPANSKPVCEKLYDGVFLSNDVKSCTVTSSQPVQCTPELSAVLNSITMYTKEGGHCDIHPGEPEIAGCFDSQGRKLTLETCQQSCADADRTIFKSGASAVFP